ncbi:TIGR02450 family Trp-rich protein [Shewanella psychrotolerans]|nr:TIGR02450 family Trp-rich protein [Shewanella psychrotolerans]
MNTISSKNFSPKKLLQSKWSKVIPINKEKHFTVVEVEFDEQNNVVLCIIEAVINRNQYSIDWRSLRDSNIWRIGWR